MNMDYDFRKAFSERLRSIRKKKGLTQAELADLAGIARASVTYYEREQPEQSRIPDAVVLYHMCRATGVSADYLLGLTDNERGYEVDIASVSHFLELSPEAIEVLRKVPEGRNHPDFNWMIDLLLRCELCEYDVSLQHFLSSCQRYLTMGQGPNIREVSQQSEEDLRYLEKKLNELGYDIVPANDKQKYFFQSTVIPALEQLLKTAKDQLQTEQTDN